MPLPVTDDNFADMESTKGKLYMWAHA